MHTKMKKAIKAHQKWLKNPNKGKQLTAEIRLKKRTVFVNDSFYKTNLSNAQMDFFQFLNCSFNFCEFIDARLVRSIFGGGDIFDCDFTGAILDSCNMVGAIISGCNFRNTGLIGADFSAAQLAGADFLGARINRMKLNGAYIGESVSFNGAILGEYRNARITATGNPLRRASRSDGHEFILWSTTRPSYGHDWFVSAGCRLIPLKAARTDWEKRRPLSSALGRETADILEMFEAYVNRNGKIPFLHVG